MNYKGYTIKIEQDDDAQSPVEDFDMLGTMVFWHRRMNLGHCWKVTSRTSPEIWFRNELRAVDYATEEWLYNSSLDILMAGFESYNLLIPVFAYEHGGITIRAASKGAYWDSWDSGQLGFIYVPHEKIIEEYGDLSEDSIERAKSCLIAEVETYDDYLTGNVHGYIVEDEDGEHLDSCWGFYGDDREKEAIRQAKAYVDCYIKDEYVSQPHSTSELAGE